MGVEAVCRGPSSDGLRAVPSTSTPICCSRSRTSSGSASPCGTWSAVARSSVRLHEISASNAPVLKPGWRTRFRPASSPEALSSTEHASGCPKLRTASANQLLVVRAGRDLEGLAFDIARTLDAQHTWRRLIFPASDVSLKDPVAGWRGDKNSQRRSWEKTGSLLRE